MDYNANMNTIHMDPRSFQVGSVRGPGMMPPILSRHQVFSVPGHRLPHGLGPGPPPMPGQGVYMEDQMDHLAGKLDMLENELRYAWRALDVLSQEYIKMWERLEKMEGLLTEQQTVITQLIDLYTADSSDNADNSFDTDGGSVKFSGFGGKDPDESFYKALNVVHRDSYPQTVDNNLPLSNFNTASCENIETIAKPNLGKKSRKGAESPAQYVNSGRIAADAELLISGSVKPTKAEGNQGLGRDESDEIRSMSSSMRSTQSGVSEIGEFPVPEDTSPTYENLIPSSGNLPPAPAPATTKRKLPQLPNPPQDTRRTRKDGYIGNSEDEKKIKSQKSVTQTNFSPQPKPSSGNKKSESKDPRIISDPKSSEKPRKKQTSAENVGKPVGMTRILEQEIQYDTYPRRKGKKKEISETRGNAAGESPLTIIDGNYSFSLSEDSVQDQTLFFRDEDQERTVVENLPRRSVSGGAKSDLQQTLPAQIGPKIKPGAGSKTSNKPRAITDDNSGILNKGSEIIETEVNSPSESNLPRANSLFQQIQAREPDPTQLNKSRKLSLKEKRKLRTEQRELVSELIPKTLEVDPPSPAVGSTLRKPDSSESDVSMRSDHSISPKREFAEPENADQSGYSSNGICMGEQQGASNGTRPRSNGINILPVHQQILSSKPSSREFAVSRALGKYRQKQKKDRENFTGSSNSDSQEELDLVADSGLEGALRTIDAKLADIEEHVLPEVLAEETQEAAPGSVVKQVSEFEEAGFAPFDMQTKPLGLRSRRQSTEESIDSEDEWYQHEITRLKEMEYEQEMQKIIPSESVGARMSTVLGQLHDVVPEIKEDIKTREKERLELDEMNKEPPDDPKPPDIVIKGEKEKRVLRRLSTSDGDDDSSVTGGADEDSETQSGADSVDEEEEELKKDPVPDVSKRPANLIILPTDPQPKLSDRQPKPDLLEEVTAAAAEAFYPDHLKNGYYGEDGIFYDEHGEAGYFDEDGTWFDYIDEVGYYDDDGEWIEYDYSKGYWGDDGNWHENDEKEENGEKGEKEKTPETQESDADHFLWVSEEGINGKYSNDQIPSSELNKPMVIGRLPSSLNEETPDITPSPITESYQSPTSNHNSIPSDISQGRSSRQNSEECRSLDGVKNSAPSDGIGSTRESWASSEQAPEQVTLVRDQGPLLHEKPLGGKRWGVLVKERKADLIELVRI